MQRGRYLEAEALFKYVLSHARASGDKLSEADALLDMSWSANHLAHFDNALDWSEEARRISVEQVLPEVTQAALGNIGWAYYKLGDAEKAQGIFLEALKQAEKLGDKSDQVQWLTNLGYIHMDSNELEVAEQAFINSLNLSRQTSSRGDIINSLIALAFLSEQQPNKLDEAKRYADEALTMARADGNKRDETYPRLVQGASPPSSTIPLPPKLRSTKSRNRRTVPEF